jgi:protein SCO1/2
MKYIVIVVFLILAAATVFINTTNTAQTGANNTVVSSGQATIGGAFSLVNQDGKPVTEATYHGKWTLIFFGFTNCPDVCLIAAHTISDAMKQLDTKTRAQITPLFVTLDPERDTPERMKKWLNDYSPDFVGLTGTKEQVREARDRYKVYSQIRKISPDGKEYLIDHSSFMYLMDPNGQYVAHFPHNVALEKLLEGIRSNLGK